MLDLFYMYFKNFSLKGSLGNQKGLTEKNIYNHFKEHKSKKENIFHN